MSAAMCSVDVGCGLERRPVTATIHSELIGM